jgi:hypothetical protein
LERVDRADFERAVAPYLSRSDPDEPRRMVLRQQGCLVEAVDAAAVARHVFLGWYDPAYTAEQRAALATRFRSLQQPERHP